MIGGLSKESLIEEAMDLFSKMKGNSCLPDVVTYETIVPVLLARDENDQAVKLLKDSKFMTPCEVGSILGWESHSSNQKTSVK
ncbi:hypothetical protein PIB30_056168 [Stylosanthes scabra]|uniref:Pentatricopeptide repeat-containing protein n=1 Tax=Stylosanthes scabra TaxID=79078 RepID=A0ABU6RJD0_9FABA|nr:hypothetical protein [Stylosanthes scabra]